jgi:hypothetical protein
MLVSASHPIRTMAGVGALKNSAVTAHGFREAEGRA